MILCAKKKRKKKKKCFMHVFAQVWKLLNKLQNIAADRNYSNPSKCVTFTCCICLHIFHFSAVWSQTTTTCTQTNFHIRHGHLQSLLLTKTEILAMINVILYHAQDSLSPFHATVVCFCVYAKISQI